MKWNILHVIDHTETGGAQEVVRYLIQSLKNDFLFDVAILGRSGRFSDVYREIGVQVYALGNHCGRWSPLPALALLQTIRHKKYDLIHTHLFRSNIIGTLAAWYTGRRSILHDHSGIYSSSLKHRSYFSSRFLRRGYLLAYRYVMNCSDRIVVLTQETLLHYQQFYFTKPGKIAVLPNAVDTQRFSKANKPQRTGTVRTELDLSPQTKLVIMIGCLEPQKDWWTFLRVAQEVQRRVTDPCAFLVVGSGSEEPMLRRYVHHRNMGRVFFLGYRDDVLNLLHQSDVFLLTSRYEAFGIALLEAMASGCPAVVTSSGGPESIVTPGSDGLVASVGDVKSLADKVIQMLYDGTLRQKIIRNAQLTISQRYSIAVVSKQMAGIYEDMLKH